MKLDIYDFDGTLVRTPTDTPENKRKFEKVTGIPWLIDKELSRKLTLQTGKFVGMRKGWFGRAETLLPPLLPDPCPHEYAISEAVEAFHNSRKDDQTMTIIMTGRHAGLKSHILRICGDLGFIPVRKLGGAKCEVYYENLDSHVRVYCLGEDGPGKNKQTPRKPNETFPWKTWMIGMFVECYPEIDAIEIWEDREEHYLNFQKLSEELPHPIKVNLIKG